MTMRTYRYFTCPNGHKGEEKTTENDQPYSACYEDVSTEGIMEKGKDARGYATYVCEQCGADMAETGKP